MAGLLELVELVHLEPKRARRQLEVGSDRHQLLERRALDRGRVEPAQAGQIDAVAVMSAIIAMQARPHSAASDWSSGRMRLVQGHSIRLTSATSRGSG